MAGTSRYCSGCRHWYDAKLHACPACGKPKHAHNRWLRTVQLNNVLQRQIADASK